MYGHKVKSLLEIKKTQAFLFLLKQCWKFKNGSRETEIWRSGTYSSGRGSIWCRAWPSRTVLSRTLEPGEDLLALHEWRDRYTPSVHSLAFEASQHGHALCFLFHLLALSLSPTHYVPNLHLSSVFFWLCPWLFTSPAFLHFSSELMTFTESCLSSYQQPQNRLGA